MGYYRGPKTVADGMIISVDFENRKLYTGSDMVIYDLSRNGLQL